MIIIKCCATNCIGKRNSVWTQLYIKNFVLVDELEIDFHAGMTVLTGETGAGKSILLDAVMLALGARAHTRMIRPDSARCEVSVQFDIGNIAEAQQWLEHHDLEDDTSCHIRRTLTREGRSRSYINGRPCPLQLTRQLGELLISLHGQHQHQALLKQETQREMLDSFAHHKALQDKTAQTYKHWHTQQKQLEALKTNQADSDARIDFLRYQLTELDSLNLEATEIPELTKEHQQLAHSEQLSRDIQQLISQLKHDDEGLLHKTHQAQTILARALNVDQSLEPIATLLEEASIQLEEVQQALHHYHQNLDLSEERLQQVEQRLATLHDIARKHRIKIEAIPQFYEKLQQELHRLMHDDDNISLLEKEVQEAADAFETAALKLRHSREKAAKTLAKHMTADMQNLGMKGGVFRIHIKPIADKRYTAQGMDTLEFWVSTNPGQPEQLMSQVVSGGELSRLSLSLHVNISSKTGAPCMIFDEVDVGIGGNTGLIVGDLLQQLGQSKQIFCITHLPQVASKGQHHIKVEKQQISGKTRSHVNYLTPEEKTEEIKRMVGLELSDI